MYPFRSLATCLVALSSFASAVPDSSKFSKRAECSNGPTSRSCWTSGFSASTNWDEKFPDTGKTVKVNLQVGRSTLAPDGTPREMIVFNGQYPGPTIVADWGDTLQITVQNNLENNGTGIHWHGMRQLHSMQNDGANGITECPIPPGGSRTYTFKATQYGTSWYHSHYSVQYGDGLVGPMIINGPASADYDIDLGALPLTDWFKTPMFEVLASKPTVPPTSQTILVNGTAGDKIQKIRLTPGKKHRLRILNTGINNNFHVGVDQHKMTVISADMIPIKPYTVESITLAVGQRYDVIIEANQKVANYYFRVGTGGGRCDGPNAQAAANNTMGAIMQYQGAGDANPTSTPLVLPQGCTEEDIAPFVETQVPPPTSMPTTLAITLDTSVGVFWKVNGESMDVDWKVPTLQYIINGTYTLPPNDNGVIIDKEGWAYYVVTNDTPLPHPMHLHGHDYWVIAEGSGKFDFKAMPKFNLNNPPRRDTHQVAGNNGTPGAGGYMVIAFKADNPGTWLMHCHIPFHISGGLGLQFVERPTEILGTLGDISVYTDGCKDWRTFEAGPNAIGQPDSGLKKRMRTARR